MIKEGSRNVQCNDVDSYEFLWIRMHVTHFVDCLLLRDVCMIGIAIRVGS